MGKNQTKPSAPFISRRTGIDRRWITTIGFCPERRSGKDRRSIQNRSFLAPIDSNDQSDQKKPFADSYSGDVSTKADSLEGPIPEQSAARIPETALADRVADD